MLLHPSSAKTDDMFGPFGIELAGEGKHRKQIGRDYGLSLDFRGCGSLFLEIRNSCGVWAKNSTRDITG